MAYQDLVIADGPSQYWRFDRANISELGWRDNASNGFYDIRIVAFAGTTALTRADNAGVGGSHALYIPNGHNVTWGNLSTQGTDNQFAGGEWTFETWYKRASSAARDRWIANREGSASRFRLLHNTAGQFYLETWDTSSITRTITSPVFLDDDWHHIVVTRSATNIYQLYVDSVFIGTHTTGTFNTSSATDAYLGRPKTGTSIGDMYFDEIAWYKKILAPARITAHYAAGPQPAPKGYTWSLWNGTTEIPCTMQGVWNGTTVVPRVSEERVP